jgi:hypothetical protein
MQTTIKELKEIRDILASIDVSLQLLATQDPTRRTTGFVSKKVICQRLAIPSVALDKLIYQGLVSGGDHGLVEGKHYCKLDPTEQNSSKFLYDPNTVIQSAWESFKNV